MPIYRGSKLVTPILPGKTLERVYRGSNLTWIAFQDLKLIFSTVGTHTYELPTGARRAEIICLGGGGGGQGGNSAIGNNGDGGGAGQWAGWTVDLSGLTSLTIAVGAGGAGGAKNQDGSPGQASTVYVGSIALSAAGGTPGTGWGNGIGDSVPVFHYGSGTYYGGAGGSKDNPGQTPGGGGGGGTGGFFGGGTAGRNGGNGRVLINLYGKEP